MEKQKFTSRIGENKQLEFEADPDNENEQKFAKEFNEVAKTHPATIQEFFERLVEVQRRKQERIIQEDDSTKKRSI